MEQPIGPQATAEANRLCCHKPSKRRARGSNPQPLTGHFISNEAASHSPTLQTKANQEHILAQRRSKPIMSFFLGFCHSDSESFGFSHSSQNQMRSRSNRSHGKNGECDRSSLAQCCQMQMTAQRYSAKLVQRYQVRD